MNLLPRTDDDELVIDFRTVSLLDGGRPRYEAISYCWDDPSDTLPVLCKPLTKITPPWTTQNLCHALVRLRLEDRSRLLWAGALCINQLDDEREELAGAHEGLNLSEG